VQPRSVLLLFVTLAVVPVSAAAADLAALERSVKREPVYESGRPRYCLLVFGPEATQRVWLVVDGTYLYADRNGNGDLTEPGKRKRALTWGGPEGTHFEFGGLAQRDGSKVQVTVLCRDRPEDPDMVSVSVAGKTLQSANRDEHGPLHFADRPKDAPIVHFAGPLRVVPVEDPVFRPGAGEQTLSVRLGTPGLGKGTFALLDYDNVPSEAHPLAEIEFPSRVAGGEPVKVRVVLKERC
jgi:hypothetical protein